MQSAKVKEREEGLKQLENMLNRHDFAHKVSDKDLSAMIRGVCDSISRDIGSSTATGKRQATQMAVFKTIARGHDRFKAKSSRQFVVSTVCDLLLARHKDRGAQLIVANNLRLVLSYKPHLEHLLWDHYRRSVACLCRELSALCLNSMEESGLEMLIQELLLCLDLLTKQKFVGMTELKHDLWNCIDSMLYKYKDVSEMHVLILSISDSLFQVAFGSDYEICHEIVPSIMAIGTKLFMSKSKPVRESSLRFLFKMEVYLVSVYGKTCPVPLDQDGLNKMEDNMVVLLQVLKNDYTSSSLQDNDVAFEEEIVLVNGKKTLQFLTCQLIAMLEYVLSYIPKEGKVKEEEDSFLHSNGEYDGRKQWWPFCTILTQDQDPEGEPRVICWTLVVSTTQNAFYR